MEEDGGAVEEVSLSIEETNRLRISLGLKPLNNEKNAKNVAAESNFANERKKQQRILERETNAEKLNARLEGKGLGAESEGEEDALTWARKHEEEVKRKKLREKKKAAKKAKEMDELDKDSLYTSGLRVGHDVEDMRDEILVLADRKILDGEEEEDELVSVAISEKERLRKHLDNLKKKPGYKGYEEDDMNGGKSKLLGHYDEVIDGPMKQGFVLNATGVVEVEDEETKQLKVAEALRQSAGGGMLVDTEYDKMREVKDYYTAEEVGFNKPKKRKKKSKTRVLEADPEIWARGGGENQMDTTEGGGMTDSFVKRSNLENNISDTNFVDDDDLQEALAKARKVAVKKMKAAPTAEEILGLTETPAEDASLSGGLVLSATSEFVNNLSTAPSYNPPKEEPTMQRRLAIPDEEDVDVQMADGAGNTEDSAGGWREPMEEGDDESARPVPKDSEEDVFNTSGAIEEEPLVASGLASTIKLLSKKGLVEKVSEDQLEREKKQLSKMKWMEQQRVSEKLRELEKEREKARNKAKGGRGGGYVDEYKLEEEQRQAERRKAREIEEKFKDYTPDVNIKYTDEYGRPLDAKEAFRHLSHKFHGKYSGKMKTEKRLKKWEEEEQLKKMVNTDTPLHTASALLEKTKSASTAHVVLSVGNRGLLPPEVVAAEEARALELKKKGSGKAKKGGGGGALGSTGQAAVPRVSTVVDAAAAMPSNREKVTFGLAAGKKRPATEGGFDVESAAKRPK
ncbi:hypothetical protein HK101_008870 [Irineochytrium annulatum]|nr:hypothetical protein HK101_008870 [Irineochytrium annulatum]